MEVLEAGEVAADDDQVHAALVLDVVVAHGLAALVEHAEGEALLAAAAQLGREDVELEPGVVRDGEAVDLGGARRGRPASASPPCAPPAIGSAASSPRASGSSAPPAAAAAVKSTASRAPKATRRVAALIGATS